MRQVVHTGGLTLCLFIELVVSISQMHHRFI